MPVFTEFTLANKFLLARMQTLVAFAVVLPRERFTADCANERPFVGMCAEVRAEVIGASEGFRAEVAVKRGWVFLGAFPAA